MIIFNLDGTLANCEHRRHFVDPKKNTGVIDFFSIETGKSSWAYGYEYGILKKWNPDWKSFYEACDKDEPIMPVIKMFERFRGLIGCTWKGCPQIWSGRCESVREKTIDWICKNVTGLHEYGEYEQINSILKMRPIGDSTPDEILKEKWLDEVLAKGFTIDYVFDDRPKVVRMWRRRGIFVFNCLQHDGEF